MRGVWPKAGSILGPRFHRQIGKEEKTPTTRIKAGKVMATRWLSLTGDTDVEGLPVAGTVGSE